MALIMLNASKWSVGFKDLNNMDDKHIEEARYDRRAELFSNKINPTFENIALYLTPPVNTYYRLLSKIPAGLKVLEIGAGMGENSEFLLKQGLNVTATDISSNSVRVLKNNYSAYDSFHAEVADMESLQFQDNSFDIVCSAGSLSYGDNVLVMNEIYRVLVNGGSFIAVDSLNNNPIYKLNRYIHYLRGNRSKSTIERMPNLNLISNYEKKFGSVNASFFGSLTWLFPLLKLIMKDSQLKIFSNWFDKKFNIKKSAFKFVMKLTKL